MAAKSPKRTPSEANSVRQRVPKRSKPGGGPNVLLTSVLAPPGSGIFTVSTGSKEKASLQSKIYGKDSGIEEAWKASLSRLPQEKVVLLGIPSDTGGGILRGASWGPLYLRHALMSRPKLPKFFDLGDVRVVPFLLHDKYLNQKTIQSVKKALYQDEKAPFPVSPLSIAEKVGDALWPSHRIFGVGGDHSCSYPLVRSYLKAKKAQGIKVALIHFDAHTDLLLQRQGIDICFGSWVPQVLPDLASPELCFQVGIRASGFGKKHWEKKFGLNQFWASEVRTKGPEAISKQIIRKLKKEKVQELYISFDLDCLDIEFASATGTPEEGGLRPKEALSIIHALAQTVPLTGADFMELAPHLHGDNAETLNSSALISECLLKHLG